MKYLKWAFKNNIGHRENQFFEIGKEIICDTWNPEVEDWEKRGGFNFTNEECALRWMSRGDTLYEVEIPSDGEVLEVKNDKTPGGIIVANKIIMKNPTPITEELLFDLYNKSKIPISTYFECIGILAARGYYYLALKIIKDKVNMDNIEFALEKYISSLKTWRDNNYDCYNKVKEVLEEIKSPIDINLFIDKDSYIKQLTNDPIINITGQSGSGKSTYAKDHFSTDDYLIVDTDEIFTDKRFKNSTGINKELGDHFRKKYKKLPDCGEDYDLIYEEILKYCQNYKKTIVIDSALFHCIKNIRLLKGKIIILRTCIDNCYNRTIERFKTKTEYSLEDLENFKNRKKRMYLWYKATNAFIRNIDKLDNNN